MKIYKFIVSYIVIIAIVIVLEIGSNTFSNIDDEYVYASDEIFNIYDIDTDDIEFDNNLYTDMVLETQYGKLSRYGPDCYGCSGYLAYGEYVGDGTIYYNDSYYGNVRILAGDRRYPFGTIVRVSYGSESFLGIVLDRGGAIGFNKVALFDLLYSSEYLADIDGVNYDTKFEVLRYGF